ncbi:hypothetical protein ACP4OV_013154 [Aristida adscensionis]
MVAMATITTMEWLHDPLSWWLLLASLAFVLLQLRLQRGKPLLPPGPTPLPIIGNMLMKDQLTHRGLAALADRYGGLLHLRLGRQRVFVASSPEYAREVLQAHDGAFSNRPATIAIAHLTYGRADMAFAHYGPFWRRTRKLTVAALFSRRRAATWRAVREECAALVAGVAAAAAGGETAVNLGEHIFGLTTRVLFRAAFGARDGGEGVAAPRRGEFLAVLHEFSQLMVAFNVGDFLPWLRWVDPQGIGRRLRATRDTLDGFIDGIVDEHMRRRRRPDDEEADMVDHMLAFLDSDDVKPIDDALRLTRDNIKGIILGCYHRIGNDIMFGGTETVASAIEWAMAELLRNPGELRRLQQELADVVGLGRNVGESDLAGLPFLACVVRETLRLHPPIPVLLHEAAENRVVGGYAVPRGARVMVNLWAIGRHRAAWKDPDAFRPSRFAAGGEGEAAGVDLRGGCFELLPFGSGRRSCPGMALGQHALELAVAQLAHAFHWALPAGMAPAELDVDDVFGLSAPRATRLHAVPTPRLTCPLY